MLLNISFTSFSTLKAKLNIMYQELSLTLYGKLNWEILHRGTISNIKKHRPIVIFHYRISLNLAGTQLSICIKKRIVYARSDYNFLKSYSGRKIGLGLVECDDLAWRTRGLHRVFSLAAQAKNHCGLKITVFVWNQ